MSYIKENTEQPLNQIDRDQFAESSYLRRLCRSRCRVLGMGFTLCAGWERIVVRATQRLCKKKESILSRLQMHAEMNHSINLTKLSPIDFDQGNDYVDAAKNGISSAL